MRYLLVIMRYLISKSYKCRLIMLYSIIANNVIFYYRFNKIIARFELKGF